MITAGTSGATGARACSDAYRIGDASQPVVTDARNVLLRDHDRSNRLVLAVKLYESGP
jgi:hypothetical protein